MAASIASMEIMVGTYEEILIGYKVVETDSEIVLEQSFTDHGHVGSIRSIACSSKYLATGSTDERIKIFDLHKRKDIGLLLNQEGSINTLQFHGDQFLFSGSEDGTLCIYSTSSWQNMKTLLGHTKGITSLSVHPSGKLAMSVSKDCKLRTWNLIKGRSAYVKNLIRAGELVQWSPEGGFYVVSKGSIADVYYVKTAAVIHSFDFGKRILAVEFINETHIAIAGEGGNVEIYAYDRGAIAVAFEAHDNRIKALKCVSYNNQLWLVTASSDGHIKMWELEEENLSIKPKLVTDVDTKCRITCMAVAINRKNVTDRINASENEDFTDEETKKTKNLDDNTQNKGTTPLKRTRFEVAKRKKKRKKKC